MAELLSENKIRGWKTRLVFWYHNGALPLALGRAPSICATIICISMASSWSMVRPKNKTVFKSPCVFRSKYLCLHVLHCTFSDICFILQYLSCSLAAVSGAVLSNYWLKKQHFLMLLLIIKAPVITTLRWSFIVRHLLEMIIIISSRALVVVVLKDIVGGVKSRICIILQR